MEPDDARWENIARIVVLLLFFAFVVYFATKYRMSTETHEHVRRCLSAGPTDGTPGIDGDGGPPADGEPWCPRATP